MNLTCVPGSIALSPYVVPKKGPRYRPSKAWRELIASRASNAPRFCEDPEQPWFEVKYSISAKSNDRCHIGSWVFATTSPPGTTGGGSATNSPATDPVICGRIVELSAAAEHATKGIAVIAIYQMLETKHPIFGMPQLTKAAAESENLLIVPTEV